MTAPGAARRLHPTTGETGGGKKSLANCVCSRDAAKGQEPPAQAPQFQKNPTSAFKAACGRLKSVQVWRRENLRAHRWFLGEREGGGEKESLRNLGELMKTAERQGKGRGKVGKSREKVGKSRRKGGERQGGKRQGKVRGKAGERWEKAGERQGEGRDTHKELCGLEPSSAQCQHWYREKHHSPTDPCRVLLSRAQIPPHTSVKPGHGKRRDPMGCVSPRQGGRAAWEGKPEV